MTGDRVEEPGQGIGQTEVAYDRPRATPALPNEGGRPMLRYGTQEPIGEPYSESTAGV